MDLQGFNALVGQDSYIRCRGKERIDPAILNVDSANSHLFSGGSVGWWVRTGYIVVDIDEGREQAIAMIKKLGIKTLMCKTPKGLHLYFKTDREYPQKVGMVLPGGLKCDYRCANKGYVMLPYGMKDRAFNKTQEVAELPLELTPLPNRKDSLLGMKDGDGRNATLFSHLMAYKHRGAKAKQIALMAEVINTEIFATPMPDDEIAKLVENTKKYAAEVQGGDNPYVLYNAKGIPNQINARAIADYFVNRGDLFVLGDDCYQYRDGVFVEASNFVRTSIKEMIGADNLITNARIMDCFRLVTDDPRLMRSAGDLNKDSRLINFKNGVFNTDTHKLVEHDSSYLQTLQIPHDYKPTNKAWENTRLYAFLSEYCELPEEDIEMIVEYMAYSLSLDFNLKTFMILQGQSNTGKSVLIRFFENLVGTINTSALSMHELNMRFYPAQLYNRLLNTCADNSSLPLSSIENLKKITGGDQIMHEGKGKEPFFFIPFAKLLFSFNQMPLQLEEKSNAFYLRMRILHMNKALALNNEYVQALHSQESVEEVIPHLLKRLPVLSIPRTETSNRLIEAMRMDSDTVHAFLNNACVIEDRAWVTKKSLFDAYVKFCLDHGREAHKKHSFIRHIRSQFIEARHKKSNEMCWRGVGLK